MCDLKGIYQESAALIMRCFRILSIEPRAVGHSVLRLILLRDGNNGGLFGTVLLSVELWSKTGNTVSLIRSLSLLLLRTIAASRVLKVNAEL